MSTKKELLAAERTAKSIADMDKQLKERAAAGEWWLDCTKGVIRRPDNGQDYTILCLDYYDGAQSAMRQFAFGEAVSVKKLEREIASTIVEAGLLKDKDRAAMLQFQRFVMRHRGLCEATAALHEAALVFADAVKKTTMEPYYVARLHEFCMQTENN